MKIVVAIITVVTIVDAEVILGTDNPGVIILIDILIIFLVLFSLCECEEETTPRKRRGSYQTTYPASINQLQIGGVNVDTYGKPTIPLHETDLYAPGVGKFLPIPQYNQHDVNLKVDLTNRRPNVGQQIYQVPLVNFITSNALDKPVQEAQEYVPPQSVGTAIIPQMPPAATPVNAVASNVPADSGAVFLGSGALGVIDLGGGAYALGSGSLGYSEMRSNPRSSFKAPLLPPVRAAPNLLPAAIPSPQPQQTPAINFNSPYLGAQHPIRNQNGYEYLSPERVGFGDPLPPRPLKTTMSFATPSNLQIQSQQLTPYQQIAPTGFGQTDSGLYPGGSYHR